MLILYCLLLSCAYKPIRVPIIIEEEHTISHTSLNSTTIRLLNWNIHKKQNTPKWQREILDANCTKDPDILLFQEVQLNANLRNILSVKNLNWKFAPNGILNKEYIGVLTASKWVPSYTAPLLSDKKEPITDTSKATLMTSYIIRKNDLQIPLLIVNVHAINFVSKSEYRHQINSLYAALSPHSHKAIIVAGDFNTWNSDRVDILNKNLIEKMALKEMPLNKEALAHVKKPGFISILPFIENIPLDRVYHNKRLSIKTAEILTCPKSSDHQPIYVEFFINE